MTSAENYAQFEHMPSDAPSSPAFGNIPPTLGLETEKLPINPEHNIYVHKTRLQSNQSISLSPAEMKSVVFPMSSPGEDTFNYHVDGAVAVCEFLTPPQEISNPEKPGETIVTPIPLHPSVIGASSRLPDSALIEAVLENTAASAAVLESTPLTTQGDLLKSSRGLLDRIRERNAVVVGDLNFYWSHCAPGPKPKTDGSKQQIAVESDYYKYALLGPAEQSGNQMVFSGIGIDPETQTAGIVPFDDPEVRRKVANKTIILAAFVTLSRDGDFIVSGPDVWLEPDTESQPYTCCVISTREQPEAISFPQPMVESFRSSLTAQQPGSSIPRQTSANVPGAPALTNFVDSLAKSAEDVSVSPYDTSTLLPPIKKKRLWN